MDLPASSTVAAVLRREGCIGHDEAAAHRPCQRFERARPNELWQMDFKGHFECRAGLHTRLLFQDTPDTLAIVALGTHEEIHHLLLSGKFD